MTNEIQQNTHTIEQPPISFGARLKATRESLGLDHKDAAAQLRLNEKMIVMMEKERYPSDLPQTFIRGYLRAYGKLLQIPEYEIKKAIEPIKPNSSDISPPVKRSLSTPVTSGHYFMQIFTYFVVFTLVGLVGIWWYTNKSSSANPPSIAPMNESTSAEVNTVISPPFIAPANQTSDTKINATESKADATVTTKESETTKVLSTKKSVANPAPLETNKNHQEAKDDTHAEETVAADENIEETAEHHNQTDHTETNSDTAD